MSGNLANITIESGRNPRHSIIWLHGLGADGHDFEPLADEFELPCAVRYVFPHAPMRPVTINGGFVMRAWYDIAGPIHSTAPRTGIDAAQDAAGIRASQAAVEALIAREVAVGIAPNNIFLAGFSQGGAIALHTALRRKEPLGGVLALSTYLPLADTTRAESQPESRTMPVFMAHGRSDTVVPCELGMESRNALRELGYAVEWHEYAMPHSVCDAELRDIEAWLAARLQ